MVAKRWCLQQFTRLLEEQAHALCKYGRKMAWWVFLSCSVSASAISIAFVVLAGIIAISLMCGGDGLADIVGRRFGASSRLPYNSTKSWAGSIAMAVGGAAFAAG